MKERQLDLGWKADMSKEGWQTVMAKMLEIDISGWRFVPRDYYSVDRASRGMLWLRSFAALLLARPEQLVPQQWPVELRAAVSLVVEAKEYAEDAIRRWSFRSADLETLVAVRYRHSVQERALQSLMPLGFDEDDIFVVASPR